MKITWLGHSCFKIEENGYVLITDPYTAGSVPGYGALQEEADCVLCSHGHGDHCAEGEIKKRTGGVNPFEIETEGPGHTSGGTATRKEEVKHEKADLRSIFLFIIL